MHYRNGREAKQGDFVINLNSPYAVGILHSTQSQSDTCNGRVALVGPNDPYVNIKDCLHIDDVVGTFPAKPQGQTP